MTAPALLRLWCGIRAPVSRWVYLASGVSLVLAKYLVEAGVIRGLGGRWMTPLEFISPFLSTRSSLFEGLPDWLGWAVFAWNVPFVWIAVSMSVRRAAAAGLSPWLGLTVVAPFVNLVIMALLSILPDTATQGWRPAAPVDESGRLEADDVSRILKAVGAAFGVGAGMFLFTVYAINTYAAAFFLGTPLVMGVVAGFLYNRPTPRTLRGTTRLGTVVMLVAGGFLLLFAFEGLICLVMAVPLATPLTILGAMLGKGVADSTPTATRQLLAIVASLPLLAGAEAILTPLPEYCVRTTVDIDAPREAVWRHVVSFPDIPPSTDWFFAIGIACPQRARIEGTGVGAVRHCEFTTGDFVEPITAWDEPARLAFDVREQPDPMVELSPWRDVRPPHLHDHSLRSRRGEFLLVDLGGGRTRLEGRTWYTFDMHPQGYWTLWSDLSIHKIHRRVLEHVKRLAEADVDGSD